jgi:AcrR family transcriptional regulator
MKKNVTSLSIKNEGPAAGALACHRDSILKAALTILSKGGRDALTTRSVAEAAHVQPPILYRLFHDKAGLLNAVADYGFETYMAKKRSSQVERDPVASLRVGWRIHVEFGLSHPELYLLMYADPQPEVVGKAAERSRRLLQDHMRRVAVAGLLRVSEERATHLFHSTACGVVLTLLGTKVEHRDMSLSDAARDAALAAILTDQSIVAVPSAIPAAITLRAFLSGTETVHQSGAKVFTDAERILLLEWLGRLSEIRQLDRG